MNLGNLLEEAKLLIGDSAKDNPEYARGIVELMASAVPFGGGDGGKILICDLLDLNPDDYV